MRRMVAHLWKTKEDDVSTCFLKRKNKEVRLKITSTSCSSEMVNYYIISFPKKGKINSSFFKVKLQLAKL